MIKDLDVSAHGGRSALDGVIIISCDFNVITVKRDELQM